MRPIITRDNDGNIHKHWTMESAEAAEMERKAELAQKIAAQRKAGRVNIFQRAADFCRKLSSRFALSGSRLIHPERL